MTTGVPVLIHTTDPYSGMRSGSPPLVLTVDGGPPRSLRYGTSRMLLPPGRHRLRIAFPLFTERGAQLVVDTSGPAPVQVYYAAPFSGFETGTLGFAPDPRAMRTRGRIRSMNKALLVTLVALLVALGLVVLGLLVWITYQVATFSI